jgi:outer membrane protein, heavy metal efflux system
VTRVFALAGVTLLLLTAAARAEQTRADLPARVTLPQVLEILNSRSPGIAAMRASIDVVAADRLTAAARPNPSLSYGGVHLFAGESTGAITQHQFVVDQPLLIFGQRQSRMALADLSLAAEKARVAAAIAERRAAVRQAFATLVARQEESRILQNSRTELQRIEQVVRARAEAGDRSHYDVLRIETERRTLDVEAANAATEVEDASGQLASLLGFPGWRPQAEGTLAPGETPLDANELWSIAQQRRPSIQAARQRQSAARGGLFVARRERLPVPTISGGAVVTHEVTGTSAVFGFSVPIPLFDRNRGPIARAAADFDAEGRALDAELAEAHAEIDRAQATFAARRQTLATMEHDLVEQIPTMRQMAENAYREGRDGILELLDASRSMREIELLHVKQLELSKTAEEALIAAAGLEP